MKDFKVKPIATFFLFLQLYSFAKPSKYLAITHTCFAFIRIAIYAYIAYIYIFTYMYIHIEKRVSFLNSSCSSL